MTSTKPSLLLVVLAAAACGSSAPVGEGVDIFGTRDPFDVPIAGLSAADNDTFAEGDALFDLSLRPYDGLGPLYTRSACSDCHDEGARGPGLVQKMIAVGPDGVTPAADQTGLPYGHTV